MHWPAQPLERIPPSAFRPQHCPRADCPQHQLRAPRRFRYSRAGSFTRKSDGRRLPRFRCLACRSRFSPPAFCLSYYLKRPELLVPIAAALHAGSAHRQIARSLACAPSTVTRLAARLGRHALLLQTLALQHLPPLREPVVLDHFETFVVRQEEALGLATPVGLHTRFAYAVDPAPHRRGGRRTPAQRRRLRHKPVPHHPATFRRSTARVLDLLLPLLDPRDSLLLISDAHPAYPAALRRHPLNHRVAHRVYPHPLRGPKGSPPNPQARLRDRQMRPADALHALLRHSCAHHRRETIAFGRRLNAVVERLFLALIWRNFVKKLTERPSPPRTPAMNLGLTDRQWTWQRVLARRLFPHRLHLPPGWNKVYRRDWITHSIGPNTLHRRVYAY